MRIPYLIEWGTGADLHGENCTKAAQRAVKDAVSHCCMRGITEITAHYGPSASVSLSVKLAAPAPQTINRALVLDALPDFREATTMEIISGGMTVAGSCAQNGQSQEQIVIVNAAVTVYLDF